MVRSYVKGLEKGAVRTKGDVVEMWEFLTCVLQQAYLPRWLGRGRDDWNVMKLLEVVDEVPPIWVVQGEQDSVVRGSLEIQVLIWLTDGLTLGPSDLHNWVCG